MKKYFFFIVLNLYVFQSFSQDNGFGIGLILGEPTGISAKIWSGNRNAFDAALAWSFVHAGAMYIHVDYIWHNFKLIHVSEGKLPFYYGIGGRLVTGADAILGARVPLGLAYMFEDVPLDTFLEITPILDLIPQTDFTINAALGIRYFF